MASGRPKAPEEFLRRRTFVSMNIVGYSSGDIRPYIIYPPCTQPYGSQYVTPTTTPTL